MICMIRLHEHTDRLARGPPLRWWMGARVIGGICLLFWAVATEIVAAFLFH